MTRRRRYLVGGSILLGVMALATMLAPLSTQGASQFANPAFQTQWQSLERVIPNFYGPLSTAYDPMTEQYVEGQYNGQSGVRLVQIFDKARLEQITPSRRITSGLLTVELKTGNLQLGDNTFAQNAPAYIGIAGDPGGGGPTYADLARLPERVSQGSGSVNLKWDPSTNTYANITPLSDPQTTFAEYLSDPNGRYGQNVPRAFSDYLKRIPGGYLLPMGYPIGPAFVANVRLKGMDNVPVVIQPFQRRVLTYTASNREITRVEFGNIGRHYYQWRQSLNGGNPTGVVPINTLTPPVFITNTPGADTATPTSTADAGATQTSLTATAAAIAATAAQNGATSTAISALATGTSNTATAAAAAATAAQNSGTATAIADLATGTANTATAAAANAQSDATQAAAAVAATTVSLTATAGSTQPTATSPVDTAATQTSLTATAAAAAATAAQNGGTATAIAALATGTSLTATASVLQSTADAQSQTATAVVVQATAFSQTQTAAPPITQTAAAQAAQATQTQVAAEATGAAMAFQTQTAVATTMTAAAPKSASATR